MALVTLTTDFGTTDGYVGAMKGVILSRAPAATVVDLTHTIPRHDVTAAAHALANAVPFFPPGSIHVAVVDPGVGTERKPIILRGDREQLFVGPDNGVFSLIAPRPQAVYEIASPEFRRERPSATFHGRDVFAPAAAALAAGLPPDQAGPAVVLRGQLPPITGADGADVYRVHHIDAFGNLVTNIPAASVAPGARLRVSGRDIDHLSRTYEDVAPGELLAYVGSRGTVEIAVREGSAAELLGAARATVVELLPPAEAAPGSPRRAPDPGAPR
ncbi:MAG TPA: SAM-dependent chlorinase/fluorinase [Kofleriaceae bacterium]|nr:SAM-dependent chlorinase/fluorinase [Kofleriaceae bacterium]